MRMSFLRLFAGMVCLVASAFFGFQTFGAIAMSRFLGGADDGTLIVLGMSFPERYSSFVICLLGLIALCFILFGVYVLRSRKVAA